MSIFPSHRTGHLIVPDQKKDFMFASIDVIECISHAGILDFEVGYASDHRTMYVNLNIQKFFSGVTYDPVAPQSRAFSSKNAKAVTILKLSITKEWERQDMAKKIARLSEISKKPSELICHKQLQKMWDAIDEEIGAIFLTAKRQLKRPKKRSHPWSPELVQAGKEQRHWKQRLQNIK